MGGGYIGEFRTASAESANRLLARSKSVCVCGVGGAAGEGKGVDSKGGDSKEKDHRGKDGNEQDAKGKDHKGKDAIEKDAKGKDSKGGKTLPIVAENPEDACSYL